MGSWFGNKNKLDEACKIIHKVTNDAKADGGSDSEYAVILLRARIGGKNFKMKDGSVLASPGHIQQMLLHAAGKEDQFAESVISASETLKFNSKKFNDFSKMLNQDAANRSGRTGPINVDSPTHGVQPNNYGIATVDAEELNKMSEEDLTKLANDIFNASKRHRGGSQ
jgi:hypothetical protein